MPRENLSSFTIENQKRTVSWQPRAPQEHFGVSAMGWNDTHKIRVGPQQFDNLAPVGVFTRDDLGIGQIGPEFSGIDDRHNYADSES